MGPNGTRLHAGTAVAMLLGLALLAVPMLALLSSDGAKAQLGPSAASGRALAERLCVSCHIVDSVSDSATVSADVPSFTAIAARPGVTAESIAGRIVLPHPPMPQVQLTREEIADLATYILSLRKD